MGCCFLKNNYKNIFDRVMKNELDLNLLYKFINILKDIEDGHMDQHVASVKAVSYTNLRAHETKAIRGMGRKGV